MKKRLAALAAVVAAACAPKAPRPIVHPTATGGCSPAHDEAGRAHWEARLDEAETRAALDAWWRATSACPADPARYLAIARGDWFLAENHLARRGDKGAAYVSLLADGAAAAEAGLAALAPGVAFHDGVDRLDASAAPLLYWWAQNAILAANAQGLWATMRVFQEVRRVMERVAEVDPDYWYGGADRYLGAFFASAPAIAGGDLERARAHLDAAVARAPAFLENLLVYAEVYAKAARDDDLHRALLEEIVAATPPEDPAIGPEQAITQEKARSLLAPRS
jgi:hypothetical protein